MNGAPASGFPRQSSRPDSSQTVCRSLRAGGGPPPSPPIHLGHEPMSSLLFEMAECGYFAPPFAFVLAKGRECFRGRRRVRCRNDGPDLFGREPAEDASFFSQFRYPPESPCVQGDSRMASLERLHGTIVILIKNRPFARGPTNGLSPGWNSLMLVRRLRPLAMDRTARNWTRARPFEPVRQC